jgi:hypothetical protein
VYCPLRKAEYRSGFDRCSDCLAALVDSREEADAAKVNLLWEGISVSKFNEIVAGLRDANVPNYSRSGADPESAGSSTFRFTLARRARNETADDLAGFRTGKRLCRGAQ